MRPRLFLPSQYFFLRFLIAPILERSFICLDMGPIFWVGATLIYDDIEVCGMLPFFSSVSSRKNISRAFSRVPLSRQWRDEAIFRPFHQIPKCAFLHLFLSLFHGANLIYAFGHNCVYEWTLSPIRYGRAFVLRLSFLGSSAQGLTLGFASETRDACRLPVLDAEFTILA